jgi:hypothetical protein
MEDVLKRLDEIEQNAINKILNQMDEEIKQQEVEPSEEEKLQEALFNRLCEIIQDPKSKLRIAAYPKNKRIIEASFRFMSNYYKQKMHDTKLFGVHFESVLIITFYKEFNQVTIVCDGNFIDEIEGIDENKAMSLYRMAIERYNSFKKENLSKLVEHIL